MILLSLAMYRTIVVTCLLPQLGIFIEATSNWSTLEEAASSKLDGHRPWPAVIHRTGPTDYERWNPIWKSADQTWLDRQPDFWHELWTDEANEKVFKETYPQFVEFWEKLSCHRKPLIVRVDLATLMYLHKYGGFYHDLDVYSLRSIRDIQFGPEVRVVLGSNVYFPTQKFEDSISNEVLISERHHPFWQLCLEMSVATPFDTICDAHEMAHIAGFDKIGNCFREWGRRYPDRAGEVIVAQPKIFHPLTDVLLTINQDRSKYKQELVEEEQFIVSSRQKFPKAFGSLKVCFLWRGVIHMIAAPEQRKLYLKQCPALGDIERMEESTEIVSILASCIGSLAERCVESAVAAEQSFTLTMATMSWSNACTDSLPPIEDMPKCKRDMPSVALLIAVTKFPQTFKIAKQLGVVSELCLLLFLRHRGYKTLDAKSYGEPAEECISMALHQKYKLPEVIMNNIQNQPKGEL